MSDYPFDHIITKLRTTRGSVFARGVMDEAADEIERLQAKLDRDEIPEPMSIEEANAEVRAMIADRAED